MIRRSTGVWILGDLADDDRSHGMGVVVEYAGATGKPGWVNPEGGLLVDRVNESLEVDDGTT